MQRCASCDRTFADDSLRFCLYDGRALTATAPFAPKAEPKTPTVQRKRWVHSRTAYVTVSVVISFLAVALISRTGTRNPGPTPDEGVNHELMAAVTRASESETLAYRTLNAAPLYDAYTGDALGRVLGILEQFRKQGVRYDPRLERQTFERVTISKGTNLAEVTLTETWSGTFYSAASGGCVSRLPAHDVPQTVYLRRVASRWIVYAISFHSTSREVAAQPCS